MILAGRPAHHDVLDDDLTLHRHLDSGFGWMRGVDWLS